jgi:hypothetical protein
LIESDFREEDPTPWLEKVHGILVPAASASGLAARSWQQIRA